MERATAFCWSKIAGLGAEEVHELGVVFTFLQHVPDRQRAEQELARLSQLLLDSGLVADVQAEGYVRKPLDWAPTPDHPLRVLFSADVIAANLEAVVAAQQPDGGWNIAWPSISPACEQEWRGWVTRNTLLTLRANGCL